MSFFRGHGIYLLAGLPLAIATAPLLMELLVLTLAAMVRPSKRTSSRSGLAAVERLIVLVPSHNEELTVRRCVESIADSAGSAGDILVVAHNCIDSTARIAREAGAMVSVLDDLALRGKGNALAHGFQIAFQELGADAVLVIDADSTVSAGLIRRVRRGLEHSSVIQCRYECVSAANDLKARLRALAFFCMNVVRPMGRARLGLSCGIFGNGFAMRREVIERVPYAAHSIVEDLEFHLSLVTAGLRCDFLKEARVWAQVPAGGAASVTQTARWEGGRLHLLRHYGPSLLLQVLQGNIRLLEPLLDLAGLPLAMEVSGLLVLLLMPVHALRLYAVAGIAIVVLHLLFAILLGPNPLACLRALAMAPLYVVSKISMVPATLRMTRSGAAWVRTSRAVAPKG